MPGTVPGLGNRSGVGRLGRRSHESWTMCEWMGVALFQLDFIDKNRPRLACRLQFCDPCSGITSACVWMKRLRPREGRN